ncbi:MAG: hypothetical protein E6R07_06125 [Nevskiaceae bacterium]|nr:MAG: hypothetical protein E6R07_06125 [Nevskiaceae bacterium]
MKKRRTSPNAQQGIALVVGLILLLIITLLGITAIRSTTQQERMASNAQQQTVVFQTAEEAIRLMMNELRGLVPIPTGCTARPLLVAALQPTSPVTACETSRSPTTSASGSSATAVISYANSNSATAAGNSAGTYVCYNFNITSTATQTGTNGWDQHIQGVCRLGPAPSS